MRRNGSSVIEWVLLNSRCNLNMKHFQTLDYSQEITLMTENKSHEEEPEV